MFNDLLKCNRQKGDVALFGALKPEGDFVMKSLHKGIHGIGRYRMCVGFILVTQRLKLCNCGGTLGKGTLCMYPSLSVPTTNHQPTDQLTNQSTNQPTRGE